MYQALYRKWRSQTFDDVIGQEHVSETLRRQVQSGRLSHAYLFVGTRGTGKTSCARILAKAINCLEPVGGNPCNKCAACVGIDNGSILDVQELDAASNNGVDNVRLLREEAVFSPVDVKKRVYIIDEVHMLSTPAFNALLKILEEPPEHLVFILATTEIHKVPATILSRCQRYAFKRILPERIRERLQYVSEKEGIDLTDDASALLARLADGSLRDALSLLDQCASGETVDVDRVVSAIGLAGSDETAAILSACAGGDAPGALLILDRLYNDGKVMTSVLESLLSLIRDILLSALMPKGGSALQSGSFNENVIKELAGSLSAARLLRMSDIIREAQTDIAKGSGGKLSAELCLIKLSEKMSDSSPAGLAMRLNELEKKLENGAFPSAPPAPAVTTPAPVTAPIATPQPAPVKEPERPVQLKPSEPQAPEPQQPRPQAAQPPVKTAQGGDLWAQILSQIKPIIDIPAYHSLNGQVTAVLEANALALGAKNPFVQGLLGKADISAAVRDAVVSITGKNLPVRVVLDSGGAAGGTDKLDALKRFSNIEFKE
jgi:DNA polymerase-3 subunit gamma/tau